MLVHLRRAIVLALITLVLTFAYALVATGASQVLFPHQADGSLTPNGSTLVGQNWSTVSCPGHLMGSCVFHGRPDDTGPYATTLKGDNPLEANGVPGESGGTNLGPRSAVLLKNTQQLVAYWKRLGVPNPTPDLVTTSGSGFDPDISPADALVQVPMVAKATGVAPATLKALISRLTNGEQLGFLGSSYIVVLKLNEALIALER